MLNKKSPTLLLKLIMSLSIFNSCSNKDISGIYQSKLQFDPSWSMMGSNYINFNNESMRYEYSFGVEWSFMKSKGTFDENDSFIILNSDTNIYSLPLSVKKKPSTNNDSITLNCRFLYKNLTSTFILLINDSIEDTLQRKNKIIHKISKNTNFIRFKILTSYPPCYTFNEIFYSEYIKFSSDSCKYDYFIDLFFNNSLKTYQTFLNDTIIKLNRSKILFPKMDSTYYYKPNIFRKIYYR